MNAKRDLSRRTFLRQGASVSAVSSIISIETLASAETASTTNAATKIPRTADVPVTTEAAQSLTNKTIASRSNTTGTDNINIREYPIVGEDITEALNAAIADLSPPDSLGGRILIPHGVWGTAGGHDLSASISIEGVGYNQNTGWGTELKLRSRAHDYVFRVRSSHQKCTIKDLGINMQNAPYATGFLLTNIDLQPDANIYATTLENVGFDSGLFGIKVESIPNEGEQTQFECILNRFERLSFISCRTAFYCNTINSGFHFDNCYFNLPTRHPTGRSSGGVAFDCPFVGNLSVAHCLFVGSQSPYDPERQDGSTVLRTVGAFNNICFFDCQEEGIEYWYRNALNCFDYVPLVFRNCLIQSKMKFTAGGAVVFDSCRLQALTDKGVIQDADDAHVRIYFEGLNNFYKPGGEADSQNLGLLGTFVNDRSRLMLGSTILPLVEPQMPGADPNYVFHASRGEVVIRKGQQYVGIYNYLVKPETLVFAQLRSFDSGGTAIRDVQCEEDYFQINLTQAAADDLKIGFKVEVSEHLLGVYKYAPWVSVGAPTCGID